MLRVPAVSEDVLQQDMRQLLKVLQKALVYRLVGLVNVFCLSVQSELEKARGHAAAEQTAMQTLSGTYIHSSGLVASRRRFCEGCMRRKRPCSI